MKEITTYVGVDAHKKDLFIAMLIETASGVKIGVDALLFPSDVARYRLDGRMAENTALGMTTNGTKPVNGNTGESGRGTQNEYAKKEDGNFFHGRNIYE
jgi:hypothetical protein